MSDIPDSPSEFFEKYLPTWFASAGAKAQAISSPGALVFHVGAETYALRLVQGVLEVARDLPIDALLQASLSSADFAAFIANGAVLFDAAERQRVLALRSLELDAERAKLLRNVDGSVLFEVVESGELTRSLLLSPGAVVAGSTPACTVRSAADDFWALARGEKNPFELLMDGKIRITGRAEVAMALSSVLMAP